MIKELQEKIKEESRRLFEANFLDGDKVEQGGQTLSSSFAMEAIEMCVERAVSETALAILDKIEEIAFEDMSKMSPEGIVSAIRFRIINLKQEIKDNE